MVFHLLTPWEQMDSTSKPDELGLNPRVFERRQPLGERLVWMLSSTWWRTN